MEPKTTAAILAMTCITRSTKAVLEIWMCDHSLRYRVADFSVFLWTIMCDRHQKKATYRWNGNHRYTEVLLPTDQCLGSISTHSSFHPFISNV
jgi:hypothetical protein